MGTGFRFSLLLVALVGLADAPATQPTDKPPLDSKAMAIADECTVLFSTTLQEYLNPDAAQLTQISDLRNRLDFQIEQTPLVDPARQILADFGQQVRDVLTPDQDKQLQSLFDLGILKPIEVRLSPPTQKPAPSKRGSQGYRSIEVLYSQYGQLEVEDATAASPAPPPAATESQLIQRYQNPMAMPDGCQQTEIVGGPGGGPFTTVRSARDEVIGFHFSVARWMGQPIIHRLEPIYSSADGDYPIGNNIVLANNGYIVGGLIVDSDRCVNAVQVMFVRAKDGKLDPSDTYTSEWCGTPTGNNQQTLGDNGLPVVGICGRRGLNLDALGLVQANANP